MDYDSTAVLYGPECCKIVQCTQYCPQVCMNALLHFKIALLYTRLKATR